MEHYATNFQVGLLFLRVKGKKLNILPLLVAQNSKIEDYEN